MVSNKKLIKVWKDKGIYISKRYCINCEEKTELKFNHIYRHSECIICRFRGKDK